MKYFVAATAASVLLAGSLAVSATPAQAAVGDCTWGNCLWDGAQYKGYMAIYAADNVSSFGAFNNKASSMRIMRPGGYRFYKGENYQGTWMRNIMYGDSIGNLADYGFNNSFESYRRVV